MGIPRFRDEKQKLIDICFDLVLTAHMYPEQFKDLDNARMADWVAEQLRECGFDTVPCGASWGVLKQPK